MPIERTPCASWCTDTVQVLDSSSSMDVPLPHLSLWHKHSKSCRPQGMKGAAHTSPSITQQHNRRAGSKSLCDFPWEFRKGWQEGKTSKVQEEPAHSPSTTHKSGISCSSRLLLWSVRAQLGALPPTAPYLLSHLSMCLFKSFKV